VVINKAESEKVEKILNKELVADLDPGIRGKFFSKKTSQSLEMVRNIDIKQKGMDEEGAEMEEGITPQPVKKNKRKEIFKRDFFDVEDDIAQDEEVAIQPKKCN
jgi:hypothetical protein